MFDSLFDWLKSNKGVKFLNELSAGLDFYGQYKLFNELEGVNLLNSKQFDLAKQTLYDSLVSRLGTENLKYSELLGKVNKKEREIIGADALYSATHGVEIYGSVVQDMLHNIDAMEKTKLDLFYSEMLNRNALISEANNQMVKYSMLQHEYNSRAKSYRLWGTLSTFSSILKEILK